MKRSDIMGVLDDWDGYDKLRRLTEEGTIIEINITTN